MPGAVIWPLQMLETPLKIPKLLDEACDSSPHLGFGGFGELREVRVTQVPSFTRQVR